jgi:hypothetical protein
MLLKVNLLSVVQLASHFQKFMTNLNPYIIQRSSLLQGPVQACFLKMALIAISMPF